MKDYIDWTIFLGMNHKNEEIRVSCKNFFVERFNGLKSIYMSLENVGKCDDIVWSYERKIQDDYYPFMDLLHSTAQINRLSYKSKDYLLTQSDPKLSHIPLFESLSVAMAKDNMFYTYSKKILNLSLKNIRTPRTGKELSYPKELEKLYQQSLIMRFEW